MVAINVESLARILIEKKSVTFSFNGGDGQSETLVATVRESDQWDCIDDEVEGNPASEPGESLVISSSPRKGEQLISTTLQFRNASEAGQAVLDAWFSLRGISKQN